MGRSNEGVDVGEVEVLKETDMAILVDNQEGDEVWVPKSVLHDDSEVSSEGDKGSLVVRSWWYEENWSVSSSRKKQAPKPAQSKAIGVSDLAAVEKLLRGKRVVEIRFNEKTTQVSYDMNRPGDFITANDLETAIRGLDKLRRE